MYTITVEYENFGGPEDSGTVEAYSYDNRPEALAACIEALHRGAQYVNLINEDTGECTPVIRGGAA